MDWFSVRRIASGLWRIAEPGHVNSWLVEGNDAALLIDAGLGILSMAETCRRLTDRPLEVVNTHGHFDHIGGDAEFERIAIHAAGVDRLGRQTPPKALGKYLDGLPKYLSAFREQLPTDQEYFRFFTPDEWLRDLPAGFAPDSWRIDPVKPTRVLSDGDKFELGGRTAEVVHTPGHTPDSVSLLLQREGYLFTGDAVNTGRIWAHEIESDLEDFSASAARLAELSSEVHTVCMAHHMRAEIDGAFLVEVAEMFDGITAGNLETEATVDDFGGPALLVRHERAAAYLPDPSRSREGMFEDWSA
ncbi:MAG: MBL fold metallo-hydrolase [Actinomycetota bacterium]